MKILLDIPDNKASLVLAMLDEFEYVKITKLTSYKVDILLGLQEGIDEMKLIKAGKIKGIPAKNILKGL